MPTNENPGSASQIANNVQEAEDALGKVVLGDLSYSRLIAYAQGLRGSRARALALRKHAVPLTAPAQLPNRAFGR